LERFRIADDRTRLKAVLGWPEDVPAFFTLRRLVPRMGLDSLLYALREVKSAGCSFVTIIGGQGPLRNELQKLIDDLGLKGLVYLVGHIPDSQLPAYYAAADAFLLPTAELECFGLIVLEALACGRPVLSTPVGAIPEILARIEPKWLARDQTPPAIADLIIEYLAGRLPRHAPEQLRHTVERLYAQPKILERLVSLALGAS
jgi:glycosyltransferase involved in cell wall biosynthesis